MSGAAQPVVVKGRQAVGQVFAMGQGDVGTDVLEKARFTPVPGLDDIADADAGGIHTLCLTADGRAEARLAQRRQARPEAMAIRLRELEKQAPENDEQLDRQHCNSDPEPVRPMRVSREGHPFTSGSSFSGSGRSSEDSTDIADGRDFRHQLQDVEGNFRKAMISNAQLDNGRTALAYHVDALNDDMEEMTEKFLQVQRDHRKLQEENSMLQEGIRQRDELIEEHGLVLALNGDRPHLVPQAAAQLLDQAGHGSLDVRLKHFAEENQQLQEKRNRLKLDLAEERQKVTRLEQMSLVHSPQTNGPAMRLIEVQREANKQVYDYKYRLRKAEQENMALQSRVSRLETQVVRFKATLEESVELEDDLKAEKRKLQREWREAQARIEELETANNHLQKRIDKLRGRHRTCSSSTAIGRSLL